MCAEHRLTGIVMVAAFAATAWLSLVAPPASPPRALSATVPAAEFSAERARTVLQELTRNPRPVGSTAHASSRAYLIDALEELGLDPQVQHATALRPTGKMIRAARVANIVARIPGTDSSGAVVIASHYDSVPNSPGASDAGHGVAAILEVARALQAGTELRNDVIVLITDAEETGLLGAQAYVDEHPWAGDTGIVLNAEARGNTGPVMMFRTTRNNGRMIRTLAEAAPHPWAESLANDIFRRMPNDTDLTVFEAAGYAGMDFAHVHGLTHYHTPLDNFETADPRSLQHHGSYLLSLSRAFGDMDLALLAAPDRIYFSLPGIGLVHYPAGMALPLALVAAFLVALLLYVEFRRRRLTSVGIGLGAVLYIALVALLPVLAVAAWTLLAGQVPEVTRFGHGSPYHSGRYLLGICLAVTAGYVAALVWAGRRLDPHALLAAPLILWSLLGLASAFWLPGASYLFLYPLLLAAAGLALLQTSISRQPARAALLSLPAVPILYFMVPMIEGTTTSLTFNQLAVPVGLLALTLGLLSIQLHMISRALGWMLPALLGIAAALVTGLAVGTAGFDETRKMPNSVNYIADVDSGQAFWYSPDPVPDGWSRQYLGPDPERAALPDWAITHLPGRAREVWRRPAEILRRDAPDATVLADQADGEGRRLRLRVTSPRGSYVTLIRAAPGGAVRLVQIDGRPAPLAANQARPQLEIAYFGLPAEGAEFEFLVSGDEPLRIDLRANIPGLPELGEAPVEPRPAHMMAAGPQADMTRLQRSLIF